MEEKEFMKWSYIGNIDHDFIDFMIKLSENCNPKNINEGENEEILRSEKERLGRKNLRARSNNRD